jgi:hypothetical protein
MTQMSPTETLSREARRLANLPAAKRELALDGYRRIANDIGCSEVSRTHARHVLTALETLIAQIFKSSAKRPQRQTGRALAHKES